MSVWNGHYACTCYHPLFVFNRFGAALERCALMLATCTALTAGMREVCSGNVPRRARAFQGQQTGGVRPYVRENLWIGR
jgi:hypothetical protein